MTIAENSRQGLEQLHQLISGLLISSAHAGELVKTLRLLIKPVKITEQELTRLGSEEKSLLLCVFKYKTNNSLDICSYEHKHLIDEECIDYYASALSGFPLPKWPFFLPEVPLDPINHFISYISAYHPNFSGYKLSSRSMCVCDDASFLLMGYDKLFKSFACSTYFSNGDSSLSFYSPELGALTVKISPLKNACGSPIRASRQLPELQYEGNLKCFELNQLKGQIYCSANFFIEKSVKANMLSDSLLESALKNIIAFQNLDEALSSHLSIQEEFLK